MSSHKHRIVRLSAAVIVTATTSLLTGSGVAAADPFDDDETVQVDQPAEQDDAGEASPEPEEEPEPGPEPEPEPEPEPTAEDQSGDDEFEPESDDPTAAEAPLHDEDPAVEVFSPETADTDAGDVDTAAVDEPEIGEPVAASATALEELRSSIDTEFLSTSDARITQWNSAWIQYSQWYQPVLLNPYRTPITIAYSYGGRSYLTDVAPLQRTILNVPEAGVYSFTALVPDPAGRVANVSVGSFSGGGYVPEPGQPAPAKPAIPTTYQNVLVSFALEGKKYKPVIVKEVVDLGEDQALSFHKVLLDAETPAWGVWGTTQSGRRSFTVSLTDRLPGLTTPTADQPAGYQLETEGLTTAPTEDSQMSVLPWIGAGLGGAAVIAVVLVLVIGRRRRPSP